MILTTSQHQDFKILYDYLRVESSLPVSADAIVVGGSGSRTEMADRAAELFHAGAAPLMVLSGFAHPEYGVNEAELLKRRTIELGVPESVIITEPAATNTGLNIILSARKLQEMGIPIKRVVLVHKPAMTRRFMATAEAQWPNPQPEFFVTSANYSFEEYFNLEHSRGLEERMLMTMIKDYTVFKTFPALGFMSLQPHDEEVEAAYKRLIAEGFAPPRLNESLSTDRFKSL